MLSLVKISSFKLGLLTAFFLLHFFCTNLLVRVKLRYTPNFTALGHLEVPYKFLCEWVGWWVVEQTNNHYQPSLNWVELSWFEVR